MCYLWHTSYFKRCFMKSYSLVSKIKCGGYVSHLNKRFKPVALFSQQICWICPQVLQMYLPFCGIAISNAQLFAASRKEYDRSRVRATGPTKIIIPTYYQRYFLHPHADIEAEYWSAAAHLLPLQWESQSSMQPCLDIFCGPVEGDGHISSKGPGSWSKSLRDR